MIYAGGTFTSIGGRKRSYIAALDAGNGDATQWNAHASYPDCRFGGYDCPDIRPGVYSLAVRQRTLYAGGAYDSIGHRNRSNLAALQINSGAARRWNPAPDGPVLALALSGSTVYAGGAFSDVGGQFLRGDGGLAAFRATTGTKVHWNVQATDTVNALAVSGSHVYIGGGTAGLGGFALFAHPAHP